jgi:hypothetical protein
MMGTSTNIGLREICSLFSDFNQNCKAKSSIFWDITPLSPLKLTRHFRRTCHLHFHCLRISQARNQPEAVIIQALLFPCVTHSINLVMEAISSSISSADLQRFTPRYISEHGKVRNHRWGNFKSYKILKYLQILIILPITKFNEDPFDSYQISAYGQTWRS